MRILSYATQEVITVSPGASIDKAICLMEERNIHHLVVTVEGRVVGILSDRDILVSTGWTLSIERTGKDQRENRTRVLGPTQVRQIMSQPVTSVTVDQTPCDAARIMLEKKIGALPLMQGEKLAGLITETDLLKWPPLAEIEVDEFLNRTVSTLMRANVISVEPSTPLAHVVHLFRSRRIRHAPVVAGDRLVGIISDRDVRRALGWGSVQDMQAECEGRLDARSPQLAADLMHEKVQTTNGRTTLRDALRTMLSERIHSLPVVEGKTLIGILTQTDFVRAFVQEGLL